MWERKDLMEYPTERQKVAHLLGNIANIMEIEARAHRDEENKVRDMIDAIDENDLLTTGTPEEKYLKAMDVVEKVLGKAFREKLSFLAHEALYGGKQ